MDDEARANGLLRLPSMESATRSSRLLGISSLNFSTLSRIVETKRNETRKPSHWTLGELGLAYLPILLAKFVCPYKC